MRNRGGTNRLTGKTTPRNKRKTHWSAKGSARHASKSSPPAKAAAGGAAKKA